MPRTMPATEKDLERYARSAAALAGLPIDDPWWPGVIRHLGVLLDRAASLEADEWPGSVDLPGDLSPVFEP